MEYHKTKDILHVKRVLGHKRIENTMVYTHLVRARGALARGVLDFFKSLRTRR